MVISYLLQHHHKVNLAGEKWKLISFQDTSVFE